jgi:SMC interacting uncharacterized protein involved in chromosome segregation
MLCFAFAVFAEDDTKTAEAIKKLEVAQKQLAQKMYKTRVKLIKNDPALKRLHKQIMALHKELALKVDSKKEMRVLLIKSEQVTRKLNALKKTTEKK